MGLKITIDSSTLINKDSEMIECCHLLDTPVRQIEVVVHPQSTIHSMVEYVDGSIIAQSGVTDMHLAAKTLDEIFAADAWARDHVRSSS